VDKIKNPPAQTVNQATLEVRQYRVWVRGSFPKIKKFNRKGDEGAEGKRKRRKKKIKKE
jgi:hypothetical protein